MKNYLDLIPIFSKIHHKQTMLTRICIALAVFLVTVIFGFADMHLEGQKTQQLQTSGNWHYYFEDIDEKTATLISARPEVEVSGWHDIVNAKYGYLYDGNPVSISAQEEKVFNDIFLGDIIEGSYPSSSNEIAISLKMKNSKNVDIGEKIELVMPNSKVVLLTVTGIFEDTARLASDNDFLVVLTPEELQVLEKYSNSIIDEKQYVVQYSLLCDMSEVNDEIMAQYQISEDQITINSALLGMLGQIDSSYASQIYLVAIVLFLIVMLTGIMMISSSLNSNIMQRSEFFGMMRCLGATKKQIMKFVRREALHWCKIAIPVGVVLGIVIVWILSAIMKAISPERFSYMPIFGVSWMSILAGILMGMITVLLAARSPAKKAAKVSPLEAISGNVQLVRVKKRGVKTKLFKIETLLGIHHAKSSRKNYILMTGAFAISIILFLCFSTLIDFMNHAMTPLKPWTPDFSVVSSANTCFVDKSLVGKIEKNTSVKNVYGRMFNYDVPFRLNGQSHSSNLISYEELQFSWAEDKLLEGSLMNVMQENQVLFIYNENLPVHVGDVISLMFASGEKELTVGGILSDSPLARDGNTETIICSEKTFEKLTGSNNYTIIDIQFKNNASDEDVFFIQSLFEGNVDFVDQRAENQEARNIYLSFSFFVYSFLFIIIMITVFNIINTVSMGVSARVKQYGTMRAIGMSDHQLVKMVMAEAATYAIGGSIVGCIIGLPLHMVIYLSMITTVWGDPWKIPYTVVGVIVTIVLTTTVFAAYIPSKCIHNLSIVETINAQ